MTDQPTEPATVPPDPDPDFAPEQDDSIAAAFSRLYEDGRSYAQAEIERQKLRVGIIGAGVRDAAILAVVAIMLIFAMLVTLLIGLILALAPQLGVWGALGAVLASTLIVALALLLLAKARIGRMNRAARG